MIEEAFCRSGSGSGLMRRGSRNRNEKSENRCDGGSMRRAGARTVVRERPSRLLVCYLNRDLSVPHQVRSRRPASRLRASTEALLLDGSPDANVEGEMSHQRDVGKAIKLYADVSETSMLPSKRNVAQQPFREPSASQRSMACAREAAVHRQSSVITSRR
jgi:hypothetical protein